MKAVVDVAIPLFTFLLLTAVGLDLSQADFGAMLATATAAALGAGRLAERYLEREIQGPVERSRLPVDNRPDAAWRGSGTRLRHDRAFAFGA